MSVSCQICNQFQGHVPELHYEHYENNIRGLWDSLKVLKEQLEERITESQPKKKS